MGAEEVQAEGTSRGAHCLGWVRFREGGAGLTLRMHLGAAPSHSDASSRRCACPRGMPAHVMTGLLHRCKHPQDGPAAGTQQLHSSTCPTSHVMRRNDMHCNRTWRRQGATAPPPPGKFAAAASTTHQSLTRRTAAGQKAYSAPLHSMSKFRAEQCRSP